MSYDSMKTPNNRMIVAMATDINQVKQCFCVINSIVTKRSRDYEYCFYILIGKEIDGTLNNYLNSEISRYTNCQIKYVVLKDEMGETPLQMEHITKATYYRLLIPELIKEEKCLYMDTDVIALKNIEELWETDLEDYLVGGVIAPYYHYMQEKEKDYLKQLNIPNMNQYINAGVLLMNLGKMRESYFTQKAIQMIPKGYISADQDIINILCYDRIKLLEFKYNYQTSYIKQKEKYCNLGLLSETELRTENAILVHFLTAYKPWKRLDIWGADIWWSNCSQTSVFNELMEENKSRFYYYSLICNKALWREKLFSEEWKNELRNKKIFVYGSGKIANKVIAKFYEADITIEKIVVTKKTENDTGIMGYQIVEFNEDMDKNAIFIVAVSSLYSEMIMNNLLKHNIWNLYFIDENDV